MNRLIQQAIDHVPVECSLSKEQWLSTFANLIIEECANRAEAYSYMSENFNALAEEIRRMKEVEEQ